ncbi:MAG: hypothetical protein ACRCY7_03260 [Cetobacterium sp.]|uniref:hypothetical protein n=1 Tax=Cetobacterium sp. TaxID=2071632 RepID=UPI003F3C403F
MEKRIIAQESHLVDFFGMAERTVRSYFAEARVSPGKYNLIECIKIYVDKTKISAEEKEMKAIDVATKKLRLEILENKYHKVEDIQRIVLDMLSNFKSKLTVIPIKLGQDLLGSNLIQNESRLIVQDYIKKSLDEALNELSAYEYKEQEFDEVLD